MQTFRLTVDPDGRVAIPDTRPGETIDIQVTPAPTRKPPLTRTTARTDAERAELAAEIRRSARELRREAGISDDERLSLTHGDMLYDENGLPA